MQRERPFELSQKELEARIEEMVDATFADISSEFLLMPTGTGLVRYPDFQAAYEVLKKKTGGFHKLSLETVKTALLENSLVLGVLRSVLGMTAPEWAELARAELDSDITQGAARGIDKDCRTKDFYQKLVARNSAVKSIERIDALITVAIQYIDKGAPPEQDGVLHRLAKFDTAFGRESLEHAAKENVPYAVLLYERYLGRPFATHRDAVSELVGEVMENAVEQRLREAGISYRKTGRAERIPGFGQAPDFCIPDEINPAVIIEAKITSDDGTARDKVARIKVLENQRNKHVSEKKPHYEVVACVDGRGFRQRRADMRDLLLILNGKVFTAATLDRLIECTRISEFVSR
ncbi:hypothetical protein [Geobacter sulfurreducens]|uniref:hypothetical protein n=1 Tax=Geobacter sulfurreducens TaxID=35554 RepID=UPI000DBB1BFE|nr:hypothetical protein [Geobacter sulfurreducens]BBA69104.1 hypothetical protein YM18_0549 [Geobacter sulfurreducens]